MPYDAKAIANYFIDRALQAGVPLTQMKLHKLLYFAHGWHLALSGKPLIDESFRAWNYGPVVPSVYAEFKRFGSDPITEPATFYVRQPGGGYRFIPYEPPADPELRSLLDQVWTLYGGLSAGKLSAMTHEEGSPWTRATGGGNASGSGQRIGNELIQQAFEVKRKARTL